MNEERDTFLARWSRRKLEVQQPQTSAPSERSPEPEGQPPAAPEPELTPEEIEALPKIEDLTPDTDITVFLRKGVPEMLRKAALRRMWSLDPAIRDYVGDARDYAYDWNLLGGVPGNGPLVPSDDVDTMLRQIFGDASEKRGVQAAGGEASDESQTGEPELLAVNEPSSRRDSPNAAVQHQDGAPVAGEGTQHQADQEREAARLRHAVPVAPPLQTTGDAPPVSGARRHGRAKPV